MTSSKKVNFSEEIRGLQNDYFKKLHLQKSGSFELCVSIANVELGLLLL